MIEILESRIAPASFIVTNLDDAGHGSLRDAIDQSNSIQGKDIIRFSKTARGTLHLSSELLVTDDLSIIGPGADLFAIDAQDGLLLTIDDSSSVTKTVSISGLTLRNGKGTSLSAPILVNENLTLSKVVVIGMDSSLSGTSALTKNGGQKLDLTNCKFIASQGEGAVSILAGDVSITKSQFVGNKGSLGGAIRFSSADGNLFISGSNFSANSATLNGGAIYLAVHEGSKANILSSEFYGNAASSSNLNDGQGGAIFSASTGSLSINKVNFVANAATGFGGAIGFTSASVLIKKSNFLVNHADASGGAIMVPEGNLKLQGTRFEGNSTGDSGGAIFFHADGNLLASLANSLSVISSFFFANSAIEDGGGLFVDDAPLLAGNSSTFKIQITSDLFMFNSAGSKGRGAMIRTTGEFSLKAGKFMQNHAADGGGGIFLDAAGDYTDVSSTVFTSNIANYGGGMAAVARGGILMDHVSFQHNYASDHNGAGGGAIYLAQSDSQLMMLNCIVKDNISAALAGGIRAVNENDVLLFSRNVVRNNIP